MTNNLNDAIRLREFTRDDNHSMAEIANNPKIAVNLRDGFPHPYLLKDAESFIEMCLKLSPPQIFAIEYNGVYVGNIGVIKGTDVYRKSGEIGYFLAEPYWNKGIMSKAVNLICDYAFQYLDVVRIHTGVFSYNPASQRVLEKCGFIREAVFKDAIFKNDVLCDEVRFAKLKD